MFARVSIIQGKPDRIDEVVRFLDKSIPRGMEGTKGVYVLVNRKTGNFMSISLWETEKAMQASASIGNKIRGQAAETAAAAPATVKIYEVALQL